jgi:hypothetical protein
VNVRTHHPRRSYPTEWILRVDLKETKVVDVMSNRRQRSLVNSTFADEEVYETGDPTSVERKNYKKQG